MRATDFIQVPTFRGNWESIFVMGAFLLVVFGFIGIPLWAITFGGFRYFNILKMWMDYTLRKDMEHD